MAEPSANTDGNKDLKDEGSGDSAGSVSLTVASKTGFNERAWNDPPPLLMNVSKTSENIVSPRPKLTSRVAFPMNSSIEVKSPSSSSALNSNGPPPISGFVAERPPKNPPKPPS